MALYDRVRDLSLSVESSERTTQQRDTSSDFVRKSTTVHLSGAGETGRGEDVSYDAEDHDAWVDGPPVVGPDGVAPGEYTLAGFSAALDDVDLFATKDPEREAARHYRRWGVESAALDLALRQAGESLGGVLGRSYDSVTFVASTRLGDPPTTDRLERLRAVVPDVQFKLDPTPEWDDDVVAAVAEVGGVRILDLKGLYEGTSVDADPDPDLYRRCLEAFPDAVVEDPAVTPETRPVVADASDRLSWDYPITGVESVRDLPFEPRWLNVKPSRFGTVESLLATVDYAEAHDITLYGGGQFELSVGRDQIQALASLLYPDGPNDVAPGAYNDPDVPDSLPASPLPAPADTPGFGGE